MEVPSNNVLPMVAPGRNPDAPDPKYLMMAAAQMHSEGRLFKSTDVASEALDGNKDKGPLASEALTKGPQSKHRKGR